MSVLTIIISIVSVFLLSGMIVALDSTRREHLKKIRVALLPITLAIVSSGAFLWIISRDYEPLGGLGTKMLAEVNRNVGSPLYAIVLWLLAPVVGLVDILITIGIFVGTAATVLYATVPIVSALPTIVALPLLALPLIFSGITTVYHAIVYVFAKPESVYEWMNRTREAGDEDLSKEDIEATGERVTQEREDVNRSTSGEVPDAVLNAYAKHLERAAESMAARRNAATRKLSTGRIRALAKYNRAFARFMNELYKDYTAHHQRKNRNRNEKKD